VAGTATELTRRVRGSRAPLDGVLDDALRSLGETLRGLVPLDSLAAPVAALLADGGLADLTGSLSLDLGRAADPPLAGVLHAAAGLPQRVAPAPGTAPINLSKPQSASAQPPAAEAGGHPVLPSPRKAPAPTAGGAAAAISGGITSVPFLALLVLAALAAPKLMRRLDAAPASLRPSLFACALERPG
jgi:hypothetical protein